jgi:hypothetical protein
MKRLILLTVLAGFLQSADSTVCSEISNFFTPYGFRTPLLEEGQYALSFNPHYYRQESELNAFSGNLVHSETAWKQYNFSLSGIYALDDDLIFQSSLILYPGQRRSTYRDVWKILHSDQTTELEMREYSNFTISPGVVLSFRPRANVQLHGDFHFSEEKSYWETEDEERLSDLKRDDVQLNLGFTMLGGAPADKPTESSDSRLFNFLRPYGFRAPVLTQGQYALNLNSFYARIESFSDYVGGPEFEKSIRKRYYFSLNGLYAATERLLLGSGLDIYPAQTRQTYDKVGVGSMWDYTEMSSGFTVSPNLILSLRPRASMELCGTFRFTREDLHKDTKFGFRRDERNDIYYLSVGYTLLGNLSLRTSGPMAGPEFSNFFTPYGFRTPMLKRGQYALSFGFHYQRTESEEDYPSSTYESDVRSIGRTYYFSLNGVYAVSNKLILEGCVSLYPGQTRLTQWDPWFDPYEGGMGEIETKQRSDFAVSPGLEISLRPLENAEFYGSFYFGKEKFHDQVSGERTAELKTEGFNFHLGFTLLGNP